MRPFFVELTQMDGSPILINMSLVYAIDIDDVGCSVLSTTIGTDSKGIGLRITVLESREALRDVLIVKRIAV